MTLKKRFLLSRNMTCFNIISEKKYCQDKHTPRKKKNCHNRNTGISVIVSEFHLAMLCVGVATTLRWVS